MIFVKEVSRQKDSYLNYRHDQKL